MSWIRQLDNSLIVAVDDGSILAVGSGTDMEAITLNYVSPDARFRGGSRALLGAQIAILRDMRDLRRSERHCW
jgi:hypothetical protein